MNCPACQSELTAGQERCPGCGSLVAPPVVGALAPDPGRATPPARGKTAGVASMRDVSGLRRREPTWKDEVRDRVQKRRRKKSPDLPLFDSPPAETSEPEPPAALVEEPEPAFSRSLTEEEAAPREAPARDELAEPEGPTALGDEPPVAEADEPRLVLDGGEPEEPEDDLPLRPPVELRLQPPVANDPVEQAREAPPRDAEAGELEPLEEEEDDWTPHIEVEPRPLERPAAFGDRFEAAAVDVGVLLLLFATVVYFASRTAQAELPALLQAWPWLVGYLACLGLGYAAWFTGSTGQTPGKMLLGLRVVETDGRAPGYLRALLRAGLGALGSVALGLGALPLFFDPARRAFHDRLLRTRVVKF